jgi:hypothetical protein
MANWWVAPIGGRDDLSRFIRVSYRCLLASFQLQIGEWRRLRFECVCMAEKFKGSRLGVAVASEEGTSAQKFSAGLMSQSATSIAR